MVIVFLIVYRSNVTQDLMQTQYIFHLLTF